MMTFEDFLRAHADRELRLQPRLVTDPEGRTRAAFTMTAADGTGRALTGEAIGNALQGVDIGDVSVEYVGPPPTEE